jgi:alginate O-acetyltransferase complex protein AlgI
VRRYVNLLVTMLIGGFWHGAGWTFVAWGFLHGVYLSVNHAMRSVGRAAEPSPGRRLAGWAVTMLAVMLAWIFFRATTFASALNILLAVGGLGRAAAQPAVSVGAAGFESQGSGGWGSVNLIALGVAVVVAVAMPNVAEIFARHRPVLDLERTPRPWSLISLRFRPSRMWLALTCCLIAASVLAMEEATPFIYFAF